MDEVFLTLHPKIRIISYEIRKQKRYERRKVEGWLPKLFASVQGRVKGGTSHFFCFRTLRMTPSVCETLHLKTILNENFKCISGLKIVRYADTFVV